MRDFIGAKTKSLPKTLDSNGSHTMPIHTNIQPPAVSILLAVRNGELFLEQSVDSVLNQKYRNFEFIITNDGSSDTTSHILDTFVARDNRIRIINNKYSIGLTRSLNNSLSVSKGEFIARIDHDDIWHPDKLDRQISFLNAHPEIGLLGTSYWEMDSDGTNLRRAVLPLCQTDDEIRRALYCYNPFFHSSIVARRTLLMEIGGYNTRFKYAQDYELWTRLIHQSKAAILPDILCYRRNGKFNISVRKEREQRLNALRSKILWSRFNGIRFFVIKAIIRDLVVILSPQFIKQLIRKYLRCRTNKC